MRLSNRRLPEPWHQLAIHNGYIWSRPSRYLCYTGVVDLLWRFRSDPNFRLRGHWYAPARITLRAPHLAARSYLLSRLLNPDLPVEPAPSLNYQSLALRCRQRRVYTCLSIQADELVVDLQRLPHVFRRILILALGESAGYPATPMSMFDRICLSLLPAGIISMHIHLPIIFTPLDRAVRFPLHDLPKWMAYAHAKIGLPYRPLPDAPETETAELSL